MDQQELAWAAYLDARRLRGLRLTREQSRELERLLSAMWERQRAVADLEPLWCVLDDDQAPEVD